MRPTVEGGNWRAMHSSPMSFDVVRCPMFDVRCPMSDVEGRTSDIGHRTSDIGHRTSDIERHRTSDIGRIMAPLHPPTCRLHLRPPRCRRVRALVKREAGALLILLLQETQQIRRGPATVTGDCSARATASTMREGADAGRSGSQETCLGLAALPSWNGVRSAP